ncbi:NUDIX domain-containing protein [Thermostaphylospora chromogena]|mgnify:CR=1 FL=1|uniref:NUDIX domain-containing protein n=1 Tax=Thermostaphylospora chromogena TaxID=35622 RepID=A0A1H1GXR1_9ACTN|nr:NUDIX hydrolase [Thermostaphylospora chromogena]SDR17616.1 NUDIX domain-containing protein [Thermostaphylospora chromogena]
MAEGPITKTLASTVVYRNPWMTVREDRVERPDGSRGIYGVVDKPDFALIIPAEDDGFHLVQEYRYPVGRRTWSFPQGGVAGVDDPREMAAVELAEETGLRAAVWEHLGRVDSSHGTSSQGCHVFLATGLTRGEARREHTEQDMVHEWVPRAGFEGMIRRGEVTDDASLAAYLLLLLRERHGIG